jgi:hypothetical protein
MDGKGSWRDNVFVERLWRTVKHEEVHLRAYARVSEARTSIALSGPLQRHQTAFLPGRSNPRSGLLQQADTRPGGGATKAEIYLAELRKLFRQIEPA